MRQLFFWTLNFELWALNSDYRHRLRLRLLNSSVSWWLGVSVTFLLGVPAIAVGLSALSFSAALQKDAAPIPNAEGDEHRAVSFELWAVLPKAQGSLLVAKKNSSEGAMVSRQVWSMQCGMPAKKCFKINQSAEGTLNLVVSDLFWMLFCFAI